MQPWRSLPKKKNNEREDKSLKSYLSLQFACLNFKYLTREIGKANMYSWYRCHLPHTTYTGRKHLCTSMPGERRQSDSVCTR